MFASLAITLLAAVGAAQGRSSSRSALTPRRCGNNPTPKQIAVYEKHFAANRVALPESKLAAANDTNATVINVYFHVITAGSAANQGNVT